MTTRRQASLMQVNRRRWDEVVALHAASRFYDIPSFRRGRSSLKAVELKEVGPVRGKSLLHLQCHIGLDTLSWARKGAHVTGLDYSPKAIAYARRLAREVKVPARFIRSDIYAARKVLHEPFDIVFTSYGALSWLPDIEGWAKTAASFVKPGGFLYIAEGHPAAATFEDESTDAQWRVVRPYFQAGKPVRFDTPGDYADFDAHVTNQVTYEWLHRLGEIVTAVAQAGLVVEYLHEFPFCPWRAFPFMERGSDRMWTLPAGMPAQPLLFSLRASRPKGPPPRGRPSTPRRA